jgi:hypothetical protein
MATKSKKWMIIPIILLALSAGSVAYGVIIGEHFIVLQKATIICMECIGLG